MIPIDEHLLNEEILKMNYNNPYNKLFRDKLKEKIMNCLNELDVNEAEENEYE